MNNNFESLPRSIRFVATILEDMALRLRRDCHEISRLQNSFHGREKFVENAEKYMVAKFEKELLLRDIPFDGFIDFSSKTEADENADYVKGIRDNLAKHALKKQQEEAARKKKLKQAAQAQWDQVHKKSEHIEAAPQEQSQGNLEDHAQDALATEQTDTKNIKRSDEIDDPRETPQGYQIDQYDDENDRYDDDYIERPLAKKETIWLTPKIDGIENFTRGIQHFSITTGIWSYNKIVIAVVYDVGKNQLFWCTEKTGAFLDPQFPLKPSHQKIPSRAVASLGGLSGISMAKILAELLRQKMSCVLRQAITLEMVYTAAGFNDMCLFCRRDQDKHHQEIGLFFLKCTGIEMIIKDDMIMAGSQVLLQGLKF